MTTKELVRKWFDIWTNGNFEDLPLTENFRHTSPYGTIEGKHAYMDIIMANKNKFLGHKFIIHDELFDTYKSCVRYTAIQNDFKLEVTEWHFIENNMIGEIVAYYNIEEKRIEIN